MEVKLKESVYAGWDCVFDQQLRREESTECVVPDTQPDIAAVLSTCGTPLIRSKDVGEGRVRVEANIPVKTAYLSEEGSVCCLDVNIPFSVSAEDADIAAGSLCTADLHLLALETKVLNPRKVSVRAELCFAVRCYQTGRIAFYGAPEGERCGVQLLEKELTFTPVCAVTEKTFVLTDEYPLPPDAPIPAQILCQRTVLETEEIKTVGTKIILKGSAKSSLLYLSAEGTPAAAEFTTGFSQIVEAEGLPEDAAVTAVLLPSGAYYDISGGGRSIGMETHVVAQLVIRGRVRLCCVTDAYSNRRALEMELDTQTHTVLHRSAVLRETLREQIETPTPVGEVLCVCAVPGCPTVNGGEAVLPLSVQMFYADPSGSLAAVKRCFTMKFSTDAAAGERVGIAAAALQEAHAVPSAGGAELRVPAELTALYFAEEELTAVTGIRFDETQELDLSGVPTLTLLRACSSDDLWPLAKANCSTVDAIRAANRLDELTAPWEQMILIPKVTD